MIECGIPHAIITIKRYTRLIYICNHELMGSKVAKYLYYKLNWEFSSQMV